jgi:hypothetical protein
VVLAALMVGSPAIGGPSLKKLVKKEVAKQLAGKTGPQSPPARTSRGRTVGERLFARVHSM